MNYSTLDDMLSARAHALFGAVLEELLDYSKWTLENRDECLAQSFDTLTQITDESVKITAEIIEHQVEGKSLLYWMVVNQYKQYMYQTLEAYRRTLDFKESLESTPEHYEWCNRKIKTLLVEIQEIEEKLATVLTTISTPTEVTATEL